MDPRFNPYRIYRNKSTGATSHRMSDVLPRDLTLSRTFTTDVFGTWRGVPFAEVEIVPAQGVDDAFCNWYTAHQRPASERTLTHIADAINEHLHMHYDWNKFHIVFASSGYDSRIISAALRRLYNETGRQPNDILFVSNIWEADSFLATGKAIGWPAANYAVCNPHLDEEHYFTTPILDFANLWHRVNAPCPFPINLWYYLVEWAQDKGLCPADDSQLQGIGGYWANETFDCFQSSAGCSEWIKRHSTWYYYNVMASLPFKCSEMLFPIANAEVMLHLPVDSIHGNGDEVRRVLSTVMAPGTIDIPKLSCDDRRHHISPDITGPMVNFYDASWWNAHIKPRTLVSSNTEFSHWWSAYTMASLCEHLVQAGHNIRVEG